MKKVMIPIVLLILAFFLIYFMYDNYSYNKRILEREINSHIIKVIRDRARYKIYYYQKNTTGFKLKITEDISFGYNNFFYSETFNIDEQLHVGDSILKAPNSLLLRVYRNDGIDHKKYKVFKGYN